jgi:hypothetical protein
MKTLRGFAASREPIPPAAVCAEGKGWSHAKPQSREEEFEEGLLR